VLGGTALLLLAALALSLLVHTRSAPAWSQQQRLVAGDTAIRDGFGISVAVSGDTAVIGADHSNRDLCAVYVITRVNGR